MYMIKQIEQCDNNYIYFCDPIKNNIMPESIFIKILYSNYNVIFNGVYLELRFVDSYFEKYYNKYKYSFNIQNKSNQDIIHKMKNMEEDILNKYSVNDKIPQYKIYEHIRCGNIKLFCDNSPKPSNVIVLKISGIWETQLNYGLTYKFINFNKDS